MEPMAGSVLEAFHRTSRDLDFVGPLQALLGEFRRGRIADRDRTRETATLAAHLGDLRAAWDAVLPGWPECRARRRTFRWEGRRGRRDAYLKRLIVEHVPADAAGRRLIVNPASVYGRHAMDVAQRLPDFEVVATDIDPTGDLLYRPVAFLRYGGPPNYRFRRESVFAPDLRRRPAAVVFFGACGSVTDGSMDYAIATESPFLICRSCCHDNIGGNVQIVRRPTPINYFFRVKNWVHRWYTNRRLGFYFSDRYPEAAYPRSRAARELMNSRLLMRIARNTADSDICRSLIDLDRCLYLKERGYDVLYRDELFFAHRASAPA
jgi:hypothetical protein